MFASSQLIYAHDADCLLPSYVPKLLSGFRPLVFVLAVYLSFYQVVRVALRAIILAMKDQLKNAGKYPAPSESRTFVYHFRFMAFVIIIVSLTMPIQLFSQRTAKPVLYGRHWVAITGKPIAATAGAMIFQKGGATRDSGSIATRRRPVVGAAFSSDTV